MVRWDSAGIEIVLNPADDVALEWTVERDFSLGGKDEGPEAFYQIDANSIGTDRRDNIYVLNPDAHTVAVFDARGGHLRSMGREGNGPGELAWPFGLSVSPEGRASVVDIGNAGLVRFAPDGTALDKVPIPAGYRGGKLHDAAFSVFGVDATESPGEQSIAVTRLALASAVDTATLLELETPATGVITLGSCGMQVAGVSRIFAPRIVWDARGDTVVATAAVEYELRVFHGTRQTASIRRPIPPRRTTAEMARAEADGMRVMTPAGVRECDADEVVEARGVAPLQQAVGAVRLAPDGTVWVSRSGPKGEPTPTDVFAPDGAYVGTLPLSVPFPAAFLHDGRILVIEADEADVERLMAYRIVRD